ncbi:hypothetical protein Tco_0263680, partial [Tanacetum coccineum]
RADYGFVATMEREIRRDPERYVGYWITDSWGEIVKTIQGAPVSTDNADHRRQEQLAKALKLVKRLQTQMAELQRQQGPANGPAQPELP